MRVEPTSSLKAGCSVPIKLFLDVYNFLLRLPICYTMHSKLTEVMPERLGAHLEHPACPLREWERYRVRPSPQSHRIGGDGRHESQCKSNNYWEDLMIKIQWSLDWRKKKIVSGKFRDTLELAAQIWFLLVKACFHSPLLSPGSPSVNINFLWIHFNAVYDNVGLFHTKCTLKYLNL